MSKYRFRQILSGDPLIALLAKTKHLVKWLQPGEDPVQISAAMAIGIVKAGIYEGKASNTRVYLIRDLQVPEPDPARQEWQPCFRTCEAPILPPSPAWIEYHGYTLLWGTPPCHPGVVIPPDPRWMREPRPRQDQ